MTYNGHKNWAHWNVSLWINNDEGLYRMALAYLKNYRTRKSAAKAYCDCLQTIGQMKTPDGAKYSISAIYQAMRGLEA